MKERLCLEVERLGLGAVIMGSRRFGAVRRGNDDSMLSSVSDYCVHHCVCPIVVVRYPEDKDAVAEAVLAVKEGEEDDEYGVVVRRHSNLLGNSHQTQWLSRLNRRKLRVHLTM
ncbi:hypothetical protein SO802_020580 [Lithocarpus litseifolius]|uniref:UspA domain-containing protein n=1 Tax=Lithocarpus litseifolius TaxID=425828 RepID=A0AAW2CF69_9ROSI